MEKKFNDLLKKTKDLKGPFKTFEFDLFKNSHWFLLMNDLDKNTEIYHPLEVIPLEISNEIQKDKEIKKEETNYHLDLLFVGDTYKKESGEEDLLAKMIQAMKVSEDRFQRLEFDPSLEDLIDQEHIAGYIPDNLKKLIDEIEKRRPKFVISLGAIATNLLLERREKMSAIHGKFFNLKANDFEYQMVPIFHPDFLNINPNMKRTAWIDLQLVMEALGKN